MDMPGMPELFEGWGCGIDVPGQRPAAEKRIIFESDATFGDLKAILEKLGFTHEPRDAHPGFLGNVFVHPNGTELMIGHYGIIERVELMTMELVRRHLLRSGLLKQDEVDRVWRVDIVVDRRLSGKG